ncbi:MAG TPA: site-2 protease family protein [Kofleriaceae bacterium]|nr:site-2 protease family protein [Kofleriaceae bacterium]
MPDSKPAEGRPHSRWAWRVGSIAGIPIYIHASFILLLVWVAMSYLGGSHEAATTAKGFVLVASVFTIVVLHELGHALVARRFGIATHDITLYPIGGISRLDHMPEKPKEELLVAIAGPAVNAVLAAAIYLGLRLSGAGAGGNPLTIGGAFFVQLMWINISLGAFNLLPAFPMDGGRILRAILGFRMDHARATAAAARIGRGLAVVMGIAGLAWSPLLVVIAIFVWMAAGQEARAERMKRALGGVSVANAMVTHVETVAPETALDAAAARLLDGFQHDFPVVDGTTVVGMLTHGDVMRGLGTHRHELTVGDVMHREYPVASAEEGLTGVLGRLPPDGSSIVVIQDDRLVGLLDPDHINKLLAVRSAAQLDRA